MKKRMYALFMALILVIAMMAPAAADEPTTGTITVKNATPTKTYNIYKVFDAAQSGDKINYTITSTSEWYTAVSTSELFTLVPTTTENVYQVQVNELKADGETAITDTDLLNFVKNNATGKTVTATKNAVGTEVKFTNADFGYYYVTTNNGSNVTISNMTENVTIIDKNDVPSWNPPTPGADEDGKFVADEIESQGVKMAGTFTKANDASIGDVVYFEILAHVPTFNADNEVVTYTFTDTLQNGFTYVSGSLKGVIEGTSASGDAVKFELSSDDLTVSGQNITVSYKIDDYSSYPANADLTITYTTLLDEDAVFDNVNVANMTWTQIPYDPNEPSVTPTPSTPSVTPPPSETDTYTYGFGLQKYKDSVADANKLTGATFTLYDAATGGNQINLVKVADGQYRVASQTEIAATGFKSAVIEAGHATVFGLDAGTYYLQEETAPDGYNRLKSRQEVVITAGESGNVLTTGDDAGFVEDDVEIINKAGTILPETGGVGTTIFTVVGIALMLGAVVLLVTKKRVNR